MRTFDTTRAPPAARDAWPTVPRRPARSLVVAAAHDADEEDASRVAEQVMRQAEASLLRSRAPGGSHVLRRAATHAPAQSLAPPSVRSTLDTPGKPLEPSTRKFMEARFHFDFARVRIHADAPAARSASDVNALAYTVGNQIVFAEGQYRPDSHAGRALIAHELVHTMQQGSEPRVQRYTPAERREMAEGRVSARQSDLDLANQRGFQPGDIVFRSGSTALGMVMGEPVTHGGIYVGNGLIHDVVGFGNRHVRVGDFYNPALGEAADASVFRVVRFRGPLRDLIVARLLRNISNRDFAMPTDPVPFNLFSSADDYRTATCLEYAHAQFLWAIQRLAEDPATAETDRAGLRSTYFAPGAAAPRALIQPTEQRLTGRQGFRYRTPGARTQEAVLMGGADALAQDVDPTRFRNRSEATYSEIFLIQDELLLRTFTYRSFVDSRRFFEDVTPAARRP